MTLAPVRRWVFVDSSAYLALLDPRDGHYRDATLILARLIAGRWSMISTNYIVAETHALILNRMNRFFAHEFLKRVDRDLADGLLAVVRVELEDEVTARQIIDRYEDKNFSMTDATSFAIMDRLGIPTAFTFDRNFAQYGLDVLTPEV